MILQIKALLRLLHRLCPAPVMLSWFSSTRVAAGVVPVGVHCLHGQHAAKVRRPKRELRPDRGQHQLPRQLGGQRSRWCQRARREPSAAVERQKEQAGGVATHEQSCQPPRASVSDKEGACRLFKVCGLAAGPADTYPTSRDLLRLLTVESGRSRLRLIRHSLVRVHSDLAARSPQVLLWPRQKEGTH